MPSKGFCLLTFLTLFSIFIAYILYLPNTQNLSQIHRIRLVSGAMKVIKFISRISEFLGISSEVAVQRRVGAALQREKYSQSNSELEIRDFTIENIPVRLYRSVSSKYSLRELRPALIYFHGGAYYLGSYDTHDSVTSRLALLVDCIVISVNYRLAPEFPFPMGVNDCTTVTRYILNETNAKHLGIDCRRTAIAGDSAGGNFAAVVGRRLANDPDQMIKPHQMLLIYPNVQFFDFRMPSHLEPLLQIFHLATIHDVLAYYFNYTILDTVVDNRHLTKEQKNKYRPLVDWTLIPEHYRTTYKQPSTDELEGDPNLIGLADQVLNPDASPLLATNEELRFLPSTYILTVEHDILRDEGFIFAGRLKANGVSVVHHHFPNAFHGSLTFLDEPTIFNIASDMLNDVVSYLKMNI